MFKRVLVLLCCSLLCFRILSAPVYAAEVIDSTLYDIELQADDVIEFSPYIVDDNGYIIEVLTPTNNSAGLAALSLSGVGSAGTAATVSIPVWGLVLVLALVAAGLIVKAVDAWPPIVEKFDPYISDTTKQEWEDAYNSGATSVVLSETASTEITNAFLDLGLNEEQVLSLPFDATGMLTYDTSIVGWGKPNIEWYPLGSSTGTYSTKTNVDNFDVYTFPSGVSVTLVPNTFFNTISTYVVKLVNGSKTAYIDYGIRYDPSSYNVSGGQMTLNISISDPVVRTFTSGTLTYHDISFYFLRNFVPQYVSRDYACDYFTNLASAVTTAGRPVILEGIGIAGLDGKVIEEWVAATISGITTIKCYFEDDSETISLPVTPIELILSPTTVIDDDDEYDIPVGGAPIYKPPKLGDGTIDAGTLNPDSVTSGDYAGTTIPDNPSVPEVDDETTFRGKLAAWLATIIATLTGIFDNIKSIPKAIADAFTTYWTKLWDWLETLDLSLTDVIDGVLAIPQAIVDGITDVLEYLFVPDLTAVQSFLDAYNLKFGWVPDLFAFGENVLDSLIPSEPPKIPINLSASEGRFDYGSDGYILDMSWYARYKPTVDSIFSGVLWFFFGWSMFRKIPDILSGVGMMEENRTLDRGHILIERKERAERRKRR